MGELFFSATCGLGVLGMVWLRHVSHERSHRLTDLWQRGLLCAMLSAKDADRVVRQGERSMPADLMADDKVSTGYLSLIRTILTTSGPVALVAIGLTIFLCWVIWGRLNVIESNQKTIMSEMNSANVAMRSFVTAHTELERQRGDMMGSQIRLLRQLCVNSSRSPEQTRGCLSQ